MSASLSKDRRASNAAAESKLSPQDSAELLAGPDAFSARPHTKKPELTDADKVLLEAEPDWERMSEGAKRLMATPPDRRSAGKATLPKPPIVGSGGTTGG